MVLFDARTMVSVTYDSAGGAPVEKAADLLAHNLLSLSGKRPVVSSDMKSALGAGVIIGLFDSPKIAAILSANHIDTTQLRGKWETYGRVVVPAPWDTKRKALLIFGSDTCGTIWGVINLTREMGEGQPSAERCTRSTDCVIAQYLNLNAPQKWGAFFFWSWHCGWMRGCKALRALQPSVAIAKSG